MAGGKEFTQETLYSDFKEIHGVKQPTKLLLKRDGEKYLDGAISDVEVHEKLDDATFAELPKHYAEHRARMARFLDANGLRHHLRPAAAAHAAKRRAA